MAEPQIVIAKYGIHESRRYLNYKRKIRLDRTVLGYRDADSPIQLPSPEGQL